MSEENKSLVYKWFEQVWNNHDENAIDELFAEDGIANGLNDADGNPLRGPEGFKTLHRSFIAAYPDLKITVEDIVSKDDKVSARCKVTGTHTGDGLGIKATNQPIDFTGMTIVKIENGKIAEAWNEFDFMKMYAQLGALKFGQRQIGETDLQANEKLIYRWFDEVWNQKREEAISEMLTNETIHHGLGGAETVEVRGIENFKEFFYVFSTAFPDLQVTIKDVFSDGEKVSARFDATATHSGEGLGIAPTGKNVEFTGMGICIVRDGKFVEVWNEIDFMKLYSQIGAIASNE